MNTIKECFDTILRGDEKRSHLAARGVRKLVYSSSASGREKYKEIADLVEAAPENYSRISEDWRQENFVMAISVTYFLHDRENQPDFLFPWLFQLLQHSNGYIRHAAVKMICHEIGPLTYHIRFPDEKSDWHKFSPEQADSILYSLFVSLNQLMSALYQPKYRRYKYIDLLPPSPYKSVQMVLFELEDTCGKESIKQLTENGAKYPDFRSNVKVETKDQILQRRREIKQELTDMLKKTKSDFELKDIKDAIYNEEGTDDMMKMVAMFNRGGDASKLSNILELINDAWNYFPHKVIGGLSPAQKLLEYREKQG